jgi:hypothetical protein
LFVLLVVAIVVVTLGIFLPNHATTNTRTSRSSLSRRVEIVVMLLLLMLTLTLMAIPVAAVVANGCESVGATVVEKEKGEED